jgi:trehalose 6-phosphate synthase
VLSNDFHEMLTHICIDSLDAVPLIYMHTSVSFPELTALYSVADVCVIASRRDGMNLVASEFIACQGNRYGVLVLSELAGTAYFLHEGSILFHPSSASDIAHAIYQAINMSLDERKERYLTLRKFIDTHTR